jgi:hypothetical protein
MRRSLAARALSAVLWTGAALLLFGAVATVRATWDGQRELEQSDAAFDANDLRGAVQHARRAASAYVPGAAHVERAHARLLAVARGAEAAGEPDVALLAWQAERAAVLESASLIQPFPERLEEANRNLARLSAMKTTDEPARGEVLQRLFKEAQSEGARRAPWGGLLPAGLLLAAAGMWWFGARALTADGRISWERGRWGILLFACGAGLWAVGAFHG